jgi:hypothetical protein
MCYLSSVSRCDKTKAAVGPIIPADDLPCPSAIRYSISAILPILFSSENSEILRHKILTPEFPPDSLIARLVELRLCTLADVQRAARRVRRMTRDLPAFDSVWVDALVQSHALTTFQARWLEPHPPESLLAGEYVLRDGLSADSRSPTFVARAANRRPVVLKRLALTEDELPAVELRLQLLVERARNCQTPHLAAAFALVPSEGGIFIASPFVAGLDLSQLLVRRGRFPAKVVVTILDQLLTALAVWHATGAVHGDLR